jgi:MFS family permease
VVPVLIMAFGMGFGMSQRTNIIAAAVPQEEIGVASSVLALARNIAGAFGIAIFATILNNSAESSLLAITSNSVINTNNPAVLQAVAGLMVLKAQIDAYHAVFVVAAAVLLVASVLALKMIDVQEKRSGVEVFVEA